MGLDLWIGDPEKKGEHCARWSYGGFAHFRQMLAKSEGIDLDAMEGYGGQTKWSTTKTNLIRFFYHSDCDGVLGWGQCERVYPRLRQICSEWNDPEDSYDKLMGLNLAAGMEECVKRKLSLYFR